MKRPDGMDHETFMTKLAVKDLTEIRAADLLILDTTPADHAIQGANVEFGFALGQHQSKQVWLVGAPTCVFHYIADRRFETWDQALEALI